MKFNTPAPLDAESGFPLLEKGGSPSDEGWGYGSQEAGLSYAATGTSLAHWDGCMLLVVVYCATIPRKPPIAAKTLGRFFIIKVDKLIRYISPPDVTIPAHRNIIILNLCWFAVRVVIGSLQKVTSVICQCVVSHAAKASLILLTSSRPMKSYKASRFETSSSSAAWVHGCRLLHSGNVVGLTPDLTHVFNVSVSLIWKKLY